MPRWCAAPTASVSGIAILSNSSSGRPRGGIICASVRPSTYSIVKNGTPSASSTAMDGDDVRVVERGDGLRFALEAGAALGVAGGAGGQHLDGDVAAQARVAGAVDLAHPAGADGGEDLVGAEAGARLESHRR